MKPASICLHHKRITNQTKQKHLVSLEPISDLLPVLVVVPEPLVLLIPEFEVPVHNCRLHRQLSDKPLSEPLCKLRKEPGGRHTWKHNVCNLQVPA